MKSLKQILAKKYKPTKVYHLDVYVKAYDTITQEQLQRLAAIELDKLAKRRKVVKVTYSLSDTHGMVSIN